MKKIINGYEYEVIDWDLVKELVPAKLPILPENSFMYALHVKGWTFEEIGKLYGVTSQRGGVRIRNYHKTHSEAQRRAYMGKALASLAYGSHA